MNMMAMLLHMAAAAFPVQSAAADAAAETSRWIVLQGSWGFVTTLDTADAKPALLRAEVLSFGESHGRLFFYIMGGFRDESAYPASITMSQAALNHTTSCDQAGVDPEDPRCAKITFTGQLTLSSGADVATGKAALFAKHPQMEHWPASHGFQVYELVLSDIWMIDFYGGGANIAPKAYFAATPKHNVPSWPPAVESQAAGTVEEEVSALEAVRSVPAAAATVSAPPPHGQVAKRARWLVYHSLWTSVGTISVHLNGKPWGNVRSVADGIGANSTGLPVLYLPTPDPTAVDIHADAHATLSFSEAALADRVTPKGQLCGAKDPEDPTCARLHMVGVLKPLTSAAAQATAAATMCARHPKATWLCHGGAHTGGKWFTIEPSSLFFLDFYGGAADLTIKDYLAASPLAEDAK